MDIKSVLPHREPFLFIDEVIDIDDKSITAKRTLRAEEEFFRGHYPGNPLMPGVLICEAMLQAGAVLTSRMVKTGTQKTLPVVTRVKNIKFRKILRPGDTMTIKVKFLEKIVNAYIFKGQVDAGEGIAASCEFTCMLVEEV